MHDRDRLRCKDFQGKLNVHATFLHTEKSDSELMASIIALVLADLCDSQALLMERASEIK